MKLDSLKNLGSLVAVLTAEEEDRKEVGRGRKSGMRIEALMPLTGEKGSSPGGTCRRQGTSLLAG